jgi:hypothetical protein
VFEPVFVLFTVVEELPDVVELDVLLVATVVLVLVG